MNFLVSCDCGHTLEDHYADDGCSRCACTHDRIAALDALIDALRGEGDPAPLPGITRRTPSGSVLRRLDFPA
jgi:uncharacterized protein YehS (DUF1456 family)